MPELPEVQTIVSDLQEIVGDQFTDFFSDFPKAVKSSSAAKFRKSILDKKIKSVTRLGKIILIELENKISIGIHLKMTGKLILEKHEAQKLKNKESVLCHSRGGGNPDPHRNLDPHLHGDDKPANTKKHLHHIFYLKKHGRLEFHDVRKFATISLFEEKDIELIKKNYGQDPIDTSFSKRDLESILKIKKNKPIKLVLMDNSVILGIGNIYASEILFDAGILPTRIAESLNDGEIAKLHTSIKKILTKAIRLRGTSVSDYRDSKGLKGSFQNELKVYKKHGQKCKDCDTMVEKVVIGQRSSFFCPKCQK